VDILNLEKAWLAENVWPSGKDGLLKAPNSAASKVLIIT